jgi:hypothetical protein
MKRMYLLASMVWLLFAVPTQADSGIRILDGNSLYDACTARGSEGSLYCGAYIRGIFEGWYLEVARSSRDFEVTCVRSTLTNQQVRDIVVDYMRRAPRDRDGFAWVQVRNALADSFPGCAK